MLHVILMILKIIGIILLVVLGILLAVFLMLLFIPVRYRLHFRKEKDILEADGAASWLSYLLRVTLSYRDKKGHVEIRAMTFLVKGFDFPGRKEPELEKLPGKAPEHSPEQDQEKPEESKAGAELKSAECASSSGRHDSEAVKDAGKEEALAAESGQNRPDGSSIADAARNHPQDHPEGLFSENDGKDHPDEAFSGDANEDSEEGAGSAGLAGRIMELVRKFLELVQEILLSVPGLPAELLDQIDCFLQKIIDKYDKICKKIAPFLTIEFEHVLERCIGYLKYILKGYAPRRIEGYLHFGTGAPDKTGQIAGLIMVLLPVAADKYQVDPDFYEAVVETDTTVYGRIHMYRLMWVAVRLLLDKEFRRLVAMIRGKDHSGGHKRKKEKKKSA